MSHPAADEALRIRAASIEDAVHIARIYNHHIDLGGATFDVTHWSAASVGHLLIQPQPEGWYVAERSGRLVGWASARPLSERYGYRHSCETAIYMAVEALGSGAAAELQRRIERHCRTNRLHHAVAKIIADNQRSIRFHRRFGYELVGIQRQIGRLEGRWIDVAIMQRLFDVELAEDE